MNDYFNHDKPLTPQAAVRPVRLNQIFKAIAAAFDKIDTSILKKAHPVGSVYINADDGTNPATLLGFGTWVKIGQGRVLAGDNGSSYTAGSTGGSEEHQHATPVAVQGGTGSAGMRTVDDNIWGTRNVGNHTVKRDDVGSEDTQSSVKLNSPESSWPPYLVVHMWKRTA